VDKDLRVGWGFKAAARTFHISRFGSDADVVGQYKGSIPTTIAMRATKRVLGAPLRCSNLFDLSQILAKLAKERRYVQEQLEWRKQIPELIRPATERQGCLTKAEFYSRPRAIPQQFSNHS
jgi:hypothetical protein